MSWMLKIIHEKLKIFEQNKRYLPSFIDLQAGYLIITIKKHDVGKYLL